jgi:hypothetical protein
MKKYSSTLNIFDDGGDFTRPDSSKISSKDLLPLHNNQDKRFQTDILINGKTQYEEKNTIIQSLEEEIVNMKHKMTFVFEKDEEIAKLKKQISELKSEVKDYKDTGKQNAELRLENRQLKEQINEIRSTQNDQDFLLTENKMLKDKLKELGEKEESLEIEEIDELVDVNVPQLRRVLLNRLKDKQTKHIEGLINQYQLKNKNKIKKSIMEQILIEAIHL